MKKITFYVLLTFGIISLLQSCKKEYDLPPVKQASDGARITIAGIKAKFNPNGSYKFASDSNLYCVVIADEVSGNLYKDVYVRDATGALHIKLIAAGGLFVGDSIRINLKSILLNHYSNLIQLDSVDIEKSVVKLASGLNPQPEVMTIAQIRANVAATNSVQSRLVRINNVEFSETNRNQPYANSATRTAINHIIADCNGDGENGLIVRTSGYAYFANEKTPGGNGSIVAIVSQFNSDMQLVLRNSTDVNMRGPLCAVSNPSGIYLKKDFNDLSVTSGGWAMQNVVGSISWSTGTFGGQKLGKISNYIAPNNITCETWLISPSINLTASADPVLSFQNAYNYSGPTLTAYVSTNYTGGLPSSTTWNQVSFIPSGGGFNFVSSGNIPMSAYKSDNTRIAFKYTGTSSSGSTWELDDIIVKEN